MVSDTLISKRKQEHLRIVLEEDVRHRRKTLLEDVQLLHEALPELNLGEIDTTVTFFGRLLASPLIICSMSGGTAQAAELNRDLAAAAAGAGIAFAVGSQRAMLEHPERLSDFAVRPLIPDGVLLGNIGSPQLCERSAQEIAELARRIEADGICVHLNAAQELAQPEGDRAFRGQLDGIARLLEVMDGRVLVKETGAGLSPSTLARLRSAGVSAVDVAGSGGTSWTRVETYRGGLADLAERQLGETFADWGVPTAPSIIAARKALGERACVVGSGGIETGLDVARALALGADVAGFARPVLLAWHREGAAGARAYVDRLARELRAALLLTGCRDLAALRRAPRVHTGELRAWLASPAWL